MFTTRAVQDGDEWVINGWKFFSSNARTASFLIVMAVTEPRRERVPGHVDVPRADRHARASTSCATSASVGEPLDEGSHALIHYDDVRVPADALLGGEGQAFAIAQTRLGGGRIHHAMRTIGMAQKALDMMCERALSRETQGSLLADKQFVQGYIADSYAQLDAVPAVRAVHRVGDRQVQRLPQGAQGHRRGEGADARPCCTTSPGARCRCTARSASRNEMPFSGMIHGAGVMGLADGPTEVHKVTVARQVLRDYRPSDDLWPTERPPGSCEAAAREVRRVPRARGGEPVIDVDIDARRRGWTTTGLPGTGAPLEHALHLRRHAERDLRDPPRRPARRAAHPAADRARQSATTASCASGGSSRRSTAPTCRTPRRSPCAPTRRCSAAPST